MTFISISQPFAKKIRPYLWLSPALLLVIAVSFWPLGYALISSLHKSNYLEIGDFIGIQNYQRFLWSDAGLIRAWNSLILVTGTLAIAMPLGFGLAIILKGLT